MKIVFGKIVGLSLEEGWGPKIKGKVGNNQAQKGKEEGAGETVEETVEEDLKGKLLSSKVTCLDK